MNSPSVLNYEIRPCKYAERKMLLVSLARIISGFKQLYQYVGFGGLSFTDFKLFHKELYINSMFSIEGGDFSQARLNMNNPYSCIKIMQGMSTDMLQGIDLTRPSIIWLDYDDVLSMCVFKDINIIFNSILPGSLYLMSCNRQLRNEEKKQPLKPNELRDLFGDIVPFEAEENCCADSNVSETIRAMIMNSCNKIIESRNKLGENIKFLPLYNIKYEENRGARMYTFGGILLPTDFDESSLNIDDLEFVKTDKPYEIIIPNLTYRETMYINQILGDNAKEAEAIKNGIINEEDLILFKKTYKFMPNFYDVRL